MHESTVHQPREESTRRAKSGRSIPPKAELSRKYIDRGEAGLEESPVGTQVNTNGCIKAIF